MEFMTSYEELDEEIKQPFLRLTRKDWAVYLRADGYLILDMRDGGYQLYQLIPTRTVAEDLEILNKSSAEHWKAVKA